MEGVVGEPITKALRRGLGLGFKVSGGYAGSLRFQV